MKRSPSVSGAAYAVAAYGSWGLFPIYFKALREIPAAVVLCHRLVWSAVLLASYLLVLGRSKEVWASLRVRGTLWTLTATTLLLAANWLTYIGAVATGHIVEASLGYFINPLLNVVLGAIFLREKLTRLQALAVALALVGVVILTVGSGVVPWISLLLAATFALYGLLRKRASVDAASGLLIETSLLVVPAAAYLALAPGAWASGSVSGVRSWGLLLLAGPITALPLLWFGNAAKRLPLSHLGFFQYLSPTAQFLIGVLLYGEPFTSVQAIPFLFIWSAVALFLLEGAKGWGNGGAQRER